MMNSVVNPGDLENKKMSVSIEIYPENRRTRKHKVHKKKPKKRPIN